MRVIVGGLVAASFVGVLLAAVVGPPVPRRVADTATPGVVVDAGAPLYAADPDSLGCLFGCGKVGVTPAAGSRVSVVCRTGQGYLKLGGQPTRWVFAADVAAAGRPPACGLFD